MTFCVGNVGNVLETVLEMWEISVEYFLLAGEESSLSTSNNKPASSCPSSTHSWRRGEHRESINKERTEENILMTDRSNSRLKYSF